ncbi:MAG: TolB family protein, partial [Promethearchaeota archaeon]
LTPDSEYKDISAGGTVNFSVKLEHIDGTENETFSISLVKNNLYEFDAELNCSFLSILPNKSAFFKVSFSAPETTSIDETETVTVIAQSTSQLGKNYSINLTCGAKTYGDRIYFLSDYHTEYYEIYSMNPDGTDVTRLTYQEINKSAPLCLSPDGTLLAYSASNNSQPVDPNKEIWILNLTDMTTMQITHNRYHDEHPDFSPNGKELCFFSKHGGGVNFSIYTIGINGSNEKEITPSELNLQCFDPAWSRNGIEIVFVAFPPGKTDMSDMSVIELYIINTTDSNDLIKITNNNKTESDPYWSKNDNFIMYSRYLGPGRWDNHSNIFVKQYPFEIVEYNRTKGQEITLINTTGDPGSRYVGIPIYSPDNQKFSYFRHNNEYLIFNLYIDDRKGITEKINLPFDVVWADWGPRRDYITRPDLAVVNISYNPVNPIYEVITTKIKNEGDAILTSAQIQFSDGHPKSGGILISEVKTISNLEPDQEIEITSDSWLNPTNGEHQIYVTVFNSTPQEDNILNNRNSIKIFIKASGTFKLDSDDDDDNDDIIESINGYALVIFFSLIIGINIILIKKRMLKISTK